MARAAVVALLLLLFAGVSPVLGAPVDPQPLQRWIVQLKPDASVDQVASTARSEFGQPALERYSKVINGFSVSLTSTERDKLAADPRVEAIVADRPIYAADNPYKANAYEIQPGVTTVIPTSNTDRLPGPPDVDIAVLDTGIQWDNPELNVQQNGYDCTDGTPGEDRTAAASWTDPPSGIGHGTHVAGIAAAIQNGLGVTGVAQGARLWSIKVLDGSGDGYWSWVICGLDHVAQMTDPDGTTPTIEVVNMSLAGPGSDDGNCGYSNSDLLHQAICHLVDDTGVTVVAAAGNYSADASGYIPAAYDEVITVGSVAEWHNQHAPPGAPNQSCGYRDANGDMSPFSDYGPDVDLVAPGECVWSLAPNDGLMMMSGTSMATPHVTGGAALYYAQQARLGDPRPTPQQVRAALIAAGNTSGWSSPDPAGDHEPLLDVSDDALNAIPSEFRIGASRQVVRAEVGTSATDSLWIAGLGGFGGSVDLSAAAPGGITTSFDSQVAAASSTPNLELDVPSGLTPGSYSVSVTGISGTETEATSFTLIVYGATSDPGGPVIKVKAGPISSVDALPVTVGWPAVRHAVKYQFEFSIDEGSWSAPIKTTATRITTTAWPGRRYQYRVLAKVGRHWQTTWQTGPSSVVNAVEPSTQVNEAPTGAWSIDSNTKAYSEEPIYSSTRNSTATFDFTGTGVAWMSIKGPTRGQAKVSLDGGKATTVNLYAGSTTNRVLVYGVNGLANGPHELVITVLGTPAGHPRVDIDALLVVSN